MKETKTGEFEAGGNEFDQFTLKFTEMERRRLLRELSRVNGRTDEAERAALASIILKLERACSTFHYNFKDAMSMQAHEDEVMSTLSMLKSTQKKLQEINELKFTTFRPSQVHSIRDGKDFARGVSARHVVDLAAENLKSLIPIIKHFDAEVEELESLPKQAGRPSSDRNSGLVYQIGKILKMNLGIILTAYDGGVFARVVSAIFEILDLPNDGNRRLLRKNAKRLSDPDWGTNTADYL